MKTTRSSSKGRATKKSLALQEAKFSLDGLRFHCSKLDQYTNPTGGALDLIPLNTKQWTAAYFSQWQPVEPAKPNPFVQDQNLGEKPKRKRIYLARKAKYRIADHLLGIGKKAYWTGSQGQSTLLGLDIDDHDSDDHDTIQAHSRAALDLFRELTGLNPFPCRSTRGINAFLICQKGTLGPKATNETWHAIVSLVNAEARRRGLAAKLEPKGHARYFDTEMKTEYGGVQFKDPFYGLNPSDLHIQEFWADLEANSVSGITLLALRSTLENKTDNQVGPNSVALESTVLVKDDSDQLLPVFQGNWARQLRFWAKDGLPGHDSIEQVVSELAKWLYFIEFSDLDDLERFDHVVNLLVVYVSKKHNGFVTRLSEGKHKEVTSQIARIVKSEVARLTQRARVLFAKIRTSDHVRIEPLLNEACEAPSTTAIYSVRTECCSVSQAEWLPNQEYWKRRAESWVYVPDETPLPEALDSAICRFYVKRGIKANKPTKIKIWRFLNHLMANSGEARLGIESLKKMGFTNHSSRQHINHLANMGVIDVSGYCPAAGVSKLFRLREAAKKMLNSEKAMENKSSL